jgi:uncharacterized protein YndB with AHSA1/START domain
LTVANGQPSKGAEHDRIEHQVNIDRPIEEVFDFLADGANNPRWQPPVIATTQTSGPLDLGTKFDQTMRHPLGFKVSANYQIVSYEPPRELALQTISGGPIRPTQRYELTANTDGATTLRTIIEYHLQGLMQIALPVLALLHPLFVWEAAWIDNARETLSNPVIAKTDAP